MSTAPRIHFKKFAFCKNDLFTTWVITEEVSNEAFWHL
jgi:hypothetical protein